jgi:hypothetical protein
MLLKRLHLAMNTDREHVQHLLDRLGPSQIAAVVQVMEAMLDPLTRKLTNAPIEDEKIGDEEELAVAEAREWLKHNQPIPHEKVLAEFGLTMTDFEHMGQNPLPADSKGSG